MTATSLRPSPGPNDMISLDFFLDKKQPNERLLLEPSELRDYHFSHMLFYGTVRFQLGEVDFSTTRWDHVPVFDFAEWLVRARQDLRTGLPSTLLFPETSDSIQFAPAGKTIQITASYVVGGGHCSFSAFDQAVEQFCTLLVHEIESAHSEIRQSRVYREARARLVSPQR